MEEIELMKQLQTVLLIAAVAALLTPLASAQSSAPRIAVDHAWLETGAGACFQKAKGALTSAGFQELAQEKTHVAGKAVLLAASISCVLSGHRTLAGVTVSGPANSGSAADLMRDHLMRLMKSGGVKSSGTETAARDSRSTFEEKTDRRGRDYRNFRLADPRPEACMEACLNDEKCKAWTCVNPTRQGLQAHCWLKNAVPSRSRNINCVSGMIKQR